MAEEQKRAVPMVVPNRVQMAEHGRNIWLITAESSESPQDFLQPEFYAHIAKDFRPFDHVEIRTDDGLYWAEYLVLTSDRNWAKVHLLREAKLQAVEQQPANSDFKIEYKGNHRKWCVIRVIDRSAVMEGALDRPAANAWLETYLHTIGRKAA